MRPFLPGLLALLVPGAFLCGTARASDEDAKRPEDTFKAFAAAMKKEEVKTALSHLTRDSQSAITGLTLFWAGASREYSASDEKNGKARIAAIDAALKRHVTADDLERFGNETDLRAQAFVALGEKVKDKPALAADFRKIATRMEGTSAFRTIGEATLKEVKIDGEKATGRAAYPSAAGKERARSELNINATAGNGLSIFELALWTFDGADTFGFQQEGGVWKIDLMPIIEDFLRPSQPSPSPQPPPRTTLPPQTTCYVARPVCCRLFSCCRLFCR